VCPLSTFKGLTEVDANANMPAQLGQIVRGAEQRGGHHPWSHTANEDQAHHPLRGVVAVDSACLRVR
jgi:hypothetical protein